METWKKILSYQNKNLVNSNCNFTERLSKFLKKNVRNLQKIQ